MQEGLSDVVARVAAAEVNITVTAALVEVDRGARLAAAEENAEPEVRPGLPIAADHAAIEKVLRAQQHTILLLNALAGKASRPNRRAVRIHGSRRLERDRIVRIGRKSRDGCKHVLGRRG